MAGRSPGWIRHKHVIPAISTPITLQSERVAGDITASDRLPTEEVASEQQRNQKGNRVSRIAHRENFAADVSIKRVGNVNQAPTVPLTEQSLRKWCGVASLRNTPRTEPCKNLGPHLEWRSFVEIFGLLERFDKDSLELNDRMTRIERFKVRSWSEDIGKVKILVKYTCNLINFYNKNLL